MTWAIVGGKGEWGSKVAGDLSEHGELVEVFDLGDELSAVSADQVYVCTPPASRQDVFKSLKDNEWIQRLILEKPNPWLPDSNIPIARKLRYVDHYLAKPDAQKLRSFMQSADNAAQVASIEIAICEEAKEVRPWMHAREQCGGVLLDLAHHALALLFHAGSWQETDITDIHVEEINRFETGKADRSLRCSFTWRGIEVHLSVGKSAELTQKHLAFYGRDGRLLHHADLSPSINYADFMLDETEDSHPALLTLDQERSIDLALKSIQIHMDGCRQEQTPSRTEEIALANHLLDNFRHRHSHYWTTYYKLLLYISLFIASPFILLLGRKTNGDAVQLIDTPCLLVMLTGAIWLVTLLVALWAGQMLNREDRRVRKVHQLYKSQMSTLGLHVDVREATSTGIGKLIGGRLWLLVMLIGGCAYAAAHLITPCN